MNEKKQNPLFGVGGVILLTVLLVLALTMFAVLTLSSAQADMRLSEKNARAAAEYYAADTQAVQLQAQAAYLWLPDQPRPAAAAMQEALAAPYEVAVSEQGSGLMISGSIPINAAGQTLQVALYLAPPEKEERWRVEQWQSTPPPTEIWQEPPLPVWNMVIDD